MILPAGYFSSLSLETLNTVPLSQKDWHVIEEGRERPLGPAFRDQLPIIVAQFKDAAALEIMALAGREPAVRFDKKHRVVMACTRDLAAIDQALFGESEGRLSCQLGQYRQQLTPRVHTDYGQQAHERFYLSRIGALPFKAIRAADVSAAPFDTRCEANALLAVSRNNDASREVVENAKGRLTEMNLLKTVPLKHVALMALRPELVGPPYIDGTLHCSTELPMECGVLTPVYSALLKGTFRSPEPY